LEDAARVTGCSFQKDLEGRRLMLQMSRPRSVEERTCVFCGAAPGQPRIASCLCEPGRDWRTQITWKDDPQSIKRGTEYCIHDVETERELLTKLLPLPPEI